MTDKPKPRKRKHPGDRISSLAGRVLGGYEPTPEEVRSMAAAILSLDIVAGPNKGAVENRDGSGHDRAND